MHKYLPLALRVTAQCGLFVAPKASMHHRPTFGKWRRNLVTLNVSATFRDNIKGALDVAFDTRAEELRIVNDLKKILPPDKAPDYAERAEMVDKILKDTARALMKLATRYAIEDEVIKIYIRTCVHATMNREANRTTMAI
jgi:hypothetical protein